MVPASRPDITGQRRCVAGVRPPGLRHTVSGCSPVGTGGLGHETHRRIEARGEPGGHARRERLPAAALLAVRCACRVVVRAGIAVDVRVHCLPCGQKPTVLLIERWEAHVKGWGQIRVQIPGGEQPGVVCCPVGTGFAEKTVAVASGVSGMNGAMQEMAGPARLGGRRMGLPRGSPILRLARGRAGSGQAHDAPELGYEPFWRGARPGQARELAFGIELLQAPAVCSLAPQPFRLGAGDGQAAAW